MSEIIQALGLMVGFIIAIVITLLIKETVSQIKNPYLEMGAMFFLFIVIIVAITKNAVEMYSE